MLTTKEFLSFFDSFFLQTFDDKGLNKNLTSCGNPSEEYWKRIIELNKKGAGVFFTPNKFKDSRKKDACLGINAWFFEIDDDTKENQMEKIKNSPLKPTFVVESKKSYHVYFMAENGTVENFEKIQRGLIAYFNSDPAIKDCTRVMRLPGFYHCKTETPFKINVVSFETESYTEEQMMEAFPEPKEKGDNYVEKLLLGDDFWDRAGKLNCEYALLKLSGSRYINSETISLSTRPTGGRYIVVNEKTSNAWIDKNGLIGSGCKGGPTIVQWLGYYGHDKKEIYKILKETFPELETHTKVERKKQENILSIVDREEKNPFTWGTDGLDEKITPIERHHYILFGGESGTGKTTFLFDFARKNSKTHKVMFLSLEMTRENLLLQTARKSAGITKAQWRTRSNISIAQNATFKKTIQELSENKNLILEGLEKDEGKTTKTIEKVILRHNPDIVIIDNLDCIELDPVLNLYQEQKRLSDFFMDFTNTYGIPLIVVHHFKKEKDKTKSMDSFMGSAKIIHGADSVVVGGRIAGEDLEPEEQASYKVAMLKDRDFGEIGANATVFFHKGTFNDNFIQTI